MKDFVKELKGDVKFDIEPVEGVKMMSEDPLELCLNNIWRPTLTLIGKGEIPEFNESGTLLRKSTYFRMSMRLPPTLLPQ